LESSVVGYLLFSLRFGGGYLLIRRRFLRGVSLRWVSLRWTRLLGGDVSHLAKVRALGARKLLAPGLDAGLTSGTFDGLGGPRVLQDQATARAPC
jgi:hypothetical protein